jgi:hypothetical protein
MRYHQLFRTTETNRQVRPNCGRMSAICLRRRNVMWTPDPEPVAACQGRQLARTLPKTSLKRLINLCKADYCRLRAKSSDNYATWSRKRCLKRSFMKKIHCVEI